MYKLIVSWADLEIFVRGKGVPTTLFFCLFLSHERILQRTIQTSIKKLLKGTVSVFLRTHIATCDFKGGEGSGPPVPLCVSLCVLCIIGIRLFPWLPYVLE